MALPSSRSPSILSAVIGCGRMTLYGTAAIVLAGAALGKVVEEFDAIAGAIRSGLAWLLFALTAGGNFWVSVLIAGIALMAVFWARCVYGKLLPSSPTHKGARASCVAVAVAAGIIGSVPACDLLFATAPTAYQKIALITIWCGYFVFWAYTILTASASFREMVDVLDTKFANLIFQLSPIAEAARASSDDYRMTFLSQLRKWGLDQPQCERVMAMFNKSGELEAMKLARHYNPNISDGFTVRLPDEVEPGKDHS